MPRRGSHGWLPLAGLALALAGCSKPPTPIYPKWAESKPAFAPSPASSNAFDSYVFASRESEAAGAGYMGFVSFTSEQKQDLIGKLAPALRKLREGTRNPCEFRFVSYPPFETAPNHGGWRLIRYSLIWQIESAIRSKKFGVAADLTALSTRVGFDLSGGGAADADLGFQFVDDARRAMAPWLGQLSPQELSALTAKLKNALQGMPTFETTARNEHQTYLQAIDWIQEQYLQSDFQTIDKELGSAVREAVTHLKSVKKDDLAKRPDYFSGFAQEAETFCSWMVSQASQPTANRRPDKEMKLAAFRPWKRFSAMFFTTLRPILARHDATVARTRLFILTSEIHRQIKIARQAPKSLDAFHQDIATDPFTGRRFQYRASGMEFRIYGVGANFQDDQGATDSEFTSPDLVLESRRD